MADLISRAEYKDLIDEQLRFYDPELSPFHVRILELQRELLDDMPAVDAVPVVRCGDCAAWETGWKPNHSIDDEYFCPMVGFVTSKDWFCAYGERRAEE